MVSLSSIYVDDNYIFGSMCILDRFQFFFLLPCSNFDPQFYKEIIFSFNHFVYLYQIETITDFDTSMLGNMLLDKLDLFFSTRINQHKPRKRVMFLVVSVTKKNKMYFLNQWVRAIELTIGFSNRCIFSKLIETENLKNSLGLEIFYHKGNRNDPFCCLCLAM